jgi:CRISPR-associated Csx2 family protein
MDRKTGRNVFITFLGTNRYTACNYFLDEDRIVNDVRFVQEAMVQLLCAQFTGNDRILVCLTEEAALKNWRDTKDGDVLIPGLQSLLTATGKAELIETITIPAGKTPDEMWSIFDCILAKLSHGDYITLDITHGFRSLPMLGLVLLHYARMLKEISVDGIYYGAFETLGSAKEVQNMEPGQRNAPIFNLTDFSLLLDWSGAVQEFTKRGNPSEIAVLLKKESIIRLRQSEDANAKVWGAASHNLNAVATIIKTCRGKQLVEAKAFSKLHENLAKCEQLPELPHPFRPLIEQIDAKIKPFYKDDIDNFLKAVEWCNEHGLIQQGITLFQEGIVTLLCHRFKQEWRKKNRRQIIESSLQVYSKKIPQEKWHQRLLDNLKLVLAIHNDQLIRELAPEFDRLSQIRNDINHAGIDHPKSAENLEKDYRNCYKTIIKMLNRHGNVAIEY